MVVTAETRLAKHLELENIVDCGLPLALEIVGERWSFMILRAALNGVRHFEDFLAVLGIARNILSVRLANLVENGIMVREPCTHDRRKVEYCLTDKGRDLLPAMLALRQWGERYELGVPSNPVLVDARDRQPIGRFEVRAHDDRVLKLADLMWLDRSEMGDETVECCSSGAP